MNLPVCFSWLKTEKAGADLGGRAPDPTPQINFSDIFAIILPDSMFILALAYLFLKYSEQKGCKILHVAGTSVPVLRDCPYFNVFIMLKVIWHNLRNPSNRDYLNLYLIITYLNHRNT